MGLAARRRLAVLVPWAALAAVTVFALVQIRARRVAEEAGTNPPAAPAVATPPPASGTHAGTRTGPEARVQATARRTLEAARQAGDALDAALTELAGSRTALARDATARRAAEARAERTAAALDVAEARLAAAAAAAEVAALDSGTVGDQERQALLAQVELLKEQLAASRNPPRRWLDVVASGDEDRIREVWVEVLGATPDDVKALGALLAQDPGRADAVAAVAGELPASPQALDLAIAVLTLPDGTARRARLVGPALLAQGRVLRAVLQVGPAAVAHEALRLLAGGLPELDTEDRALLRDRIQERFDAPNAWPDATTLAVVGALKLEGLAPAVAEQLADGDATTRAAAAHALSRVPDLASVRGAAARALGGLLLDESLAVRIGGLHLAEALLGTTLDAYDPSGGVAARREAVTQILQAL